MKRFVLFSISLAVVVGMPLVVPDVLLPPILTEDQHPLVGDWLPEQGYVVVEEPAPQPRLKEAEERGKQDDIHVKEKPQVKDEPQLKVELDVKEKTEDKKPEQWPEAILGDAVDPEPSHPDFIKVESVVKVEPENQEKSEFDGKSETGLEGQKKHIDTEGLYETTQPIIHLEPINDEDDIKSDEEKQIITDETMDQPIMYLEPMNDEEDVKYDEEKQIEIRDETMDQPIVHLEPMNDDEDVKYDEEKQMNMERRDETMDQPLMYLEPMNDDEDVKYDEEKQMNMERRDETMDQPLMYLEPMNDDEDVKSDEEKQIERTDDTINKLIMHLETINDDDDDVKFEEEKQIDTERTDESMDQPIMLRTEYPDQEFVESVIDTIPMMDETEMNGDSQSKEGGGYPPVCPGVVLQGKCYVFHRGPKRAEEAEFFCQRSFPQGHLASITNKHIHRGVMRLILETNRAYTRTWIGGLRYLGTGRFVWLDGEHWGYADWLLGEPNNTSDLEDCVEVLAYGPGKFNDFTCWEPQAFVCSYPYHTENFHKSQI